MEQMSETTQDKIDALTWDLSHLEGMIDELRTTILIGNFKSEDSRGYLVGQLNECKSERSRIESELKILKQQ